MLVRPRRRWSQPWISNRPPRSRAAICPVRVALPPTGTASMTERPSPAATTLSPFVSTVAGSAVHLLSFSGGPSGTVNQEMLHLRAAVSADGTEGSADGFGGAG